jgi:hypothetical protein
VGEFHEQEGLDDLVAAPLPAGQVLQALLDRGVVQPWHSSLLPGNAIHPRGVASQLTKPLEQGRAGACS